VAQELVKRWLREQLHDREIFSTPSAVKDYLRLHFAGYEREVFAVMYLDAQLRLIDVEEIFQGTARQVAIYPREVVKAALRRNAASVILSHNHPSGDAEPSRADIDITAAITLALGLLDVRVLDHIVVGAGGCVSFAESGLL
jgi:DNA repair protein RadC